VFGVRANGAQGGLVAEGTSRFLIGAMLIGSASLLAGCESQAIAIRQDMLSAAGFVQKAAKTPEEMETLRNMPQHEVFTQERDGRLLYVFADAMYCRCIYVGDERDYRRYISIRVEQRIVLKRVLDENFSGFGRRVWGPWDPL